MKHEMGCTCDLCVAYRAAMRQNADPLMRKKIQPTRTIVPVEQAIAQLCEAKDCYLDRIAEIDLRLKDLRDI